MKTFFRLLSFLKLCPVMTFFTLVLVVISSFLAFTTPIFLQQIIDTLWDFDKNSNSDLQIIWKLALIWLVFIVVRNTVIFTFNYLARLLGQYASEEAYRISVASGKS